MMLAEVDAKMEGYGGCCGERGRGLDSGRAAAELVEVEEPEKCVVHCELLTGDC